MKKETNKPEKEENKPPKKDYYSSPLKEHHEYADDGADCNGCD